MFDEIDISRIETCFGSPMKLSSFCNVWFEVHVERYDSDYVPFMCRVTWCKQKDFRVQTWICQFVENSMDGIQFGQHTMKIGEYRKYRIHGILRGRFDYFGEYDDNLEILKVKRIK